MILSAGRADGPVLGGIIDGHLVLAVEVGEADLGGVLERAVGLAPRPGPHGRATVPRPTGGDGQPTPASQVSRSRD